MYAAHVSYQVFARKYRPRTFQDVLGQDHVVRTLCNAIEQKRLAHAYLFVGPRGTGKTSTARIFAKALNCSGGPRVDFDPDEDVCREIAEGRSLDVLEIDGASNRGIDNIRDLRDNVQFTPTRGQYRIIYIDEVHMLTKESFNALLKTLEEPPAHVMFIFATTEPHKILPTILSRCQRFDLRPIPTDIIAQHLVNIAAKEGVELSEDAAFAIATVADGGMRDAQSMLDQLVAFCGNRIDEQNVNDIFGVTGRETVARALCYLLDRQLPSLLHIVHELAGIGRDMGQFLAEMIGGVRELLIAKVAPEESSNTMPAAWREPLMEHINRTPLDKIMSLMEVLSAAEEQMRWSTNKRMYLEIGLIQAVHTLSQANISDIIRALDGAPLPETPIATTLLPQIPLPAVGSEMIAKTIEPSRDPVSKAQEEPQIEEELSASPECEPINDGPPEFGQSTGQVAMTAQDWDELLEEARRVAPLQMGMVGNTIFVAEEGGLVTIGIHSEDTDTRDGLLSDSVREALKDVAGKRGYEISQFRIVTDDSVPPPVEEEEEPQSIAPESFKKERKEKEEAASARDGEKGSGAMQAEDFYKDPLIEKAMSEFQAQIVD